MSGKPGMIVHPHRPSLSPRMGFVVDVIGYGRRTYQAQAGVEARLTPLVMAILADIDIDRDQVCVDGRSGDSIVVFFPVGADPTAVLPGLLLAAANRLMHENARSQDPMRMRMAVGFGLAGFGAWGMSGPLVVDLSRLNDCEQIRQAALEHRELDLVALVSNALFDYLVRSGPLPSCLGTFRRVEVAHKEFSEPAWLWLSSMLNAIG